MLGAFTWTVNLASTFILDTLGALVKLLIPRSWAHQGAQIMGWIVAVPDYAGHITTPGGQHQYGFAGINNLRSLFMWLGMALAPLTLTHATARAMVGDAEADPIGIPLLRIVFAGALILLYPYLWAQGAALADQITHVILSLPDVTSGLQKLMDYAVDGVALGGWQLIDLGLMGAIAIELLGLIFLKVVLILVGALLYATGPLTIGLVPTRFGHAVARAWVSAVIFLLTIGVAWATIFAVGALLIEDSGTAGPLIGGNSAFGGLVGGLILAVTGLVSLWLCLKVAKEAGGILRMQLGGLFALTAVRGGSGSTVASSAAATRTSGSSLRSFGSRVSAGARGAGAELAAATPGGRQARLALAGAGYVGRRGLAGTAAAGARYAGSQVAAPAAAMIGRSRAGAVAVRMAKTGTASYTSGAPGANETQGAPNGAAPGPATAPRQAAGNADGAQARSATRRNRKPRPGTARDQTQRAGNAFGASTGSSGPSGPIRRDAAPRQPPGRAAAASDRGGRDERGSRVRSSSDPSGGRVARPAIAPSTAGAPARSTQPTPVREVSDRDGRGSTPPPAPRPTRASQPPARPARGNDQAVDREARRPTTNRESAPIKTTQPPAAPHPNRQPPPSATPDGSRQ